MIYKDKDPTYKTLLLQEALEARFLYRGSIDNWFGPKTEAAYIEFLRSQNAKTIGGLASTFADPDDLAAFKRCKALGKTDHECFQIGDNGLGYWSDDTTTEDVAMAAFAQSTLKDRFGDDWKTKARHAKVRVTYKDRVCDCILGDCGAPEGRIDLNPGACKKLGIQPGDLVSASWEWV